MNSSPTHDALVSLGYRLVENKWAEHGRRTYVYDDEAARAHIKSLGDALQKAGWLSTKIIALLLPPLSK